MPKKALTPPEKLLEDVPAIHESEVERLQKLVQEDANARLEEFMRRVKAAADELRCGMMGRTTIEGDKFTTEVVPFAKR